MICPKCGGCLDIDDVLFEESNGLMMECYCPECDIWVRED